MIMRDGVRPFGNLRIRHGTRNFTRASRFYPDSASRGPISRVCILLRFLLKRVWGTSKSEIVVTSVVTLVSPNRKTQ